MATDRTNIGYKFENGDIPSQGDFQEVFNSFIHKDEDKADFQMVETGTDDQHYVTPALLRTGLQNIGIITGNSYMPYKEQFDNFIGNSLPLKYPPVRYSVKAFKNGQLLFEREGEGNEGDYIINYDNAVITFSSNIDNRNIEVAYWYKNLTPNPGGGSNGEQIDFSSFLHTSGNETKDGILTFNNTTPTPTSGIVLTNSGADAGAKVMDVTVSGAGSGISVQNTATGTGIKLSNSGAGTGVQVDLTAAATGDPLKVTKDNVVKAKIDSEGIVTAKEFITEGGTAEKFVKGDGSLDPKTYAEENKVIHIEGNEVRDGALKLTHDDSVEDVLTIEKNNSANCLKLIQNSTSNATTSTFYTNSANVNRKAISIQKGENENAFITHDGNVSGTSFTTLNEKADITDGLLTLAGSTSPTATAGHAKLYAKTSGTTDLYVMGSDGVEKKIGASGGTTISGTANKITKFNSTGNNVTDSNITDNGSLVTISKPTSIDSGTNGNSGLTLNKLPLSGSAIVSTFITSVGTIGKAAALIFKDGYYYSTNQDGNIYKTSKSTGVTTIFSTIGSNLLYLCFANDGNMYVTRLGGNVYKVDPSGAATLFKTGLAANLYGIVQGPDSNLYIVELHGTIYKLTLSGDLSTLTTVANSYDICVGVDDNLYIMNANSGGILYKVTLTGIVTTFATNVSGGTAAPFAIAKLSDGSFISNTANNIYRISNTGVVTAITAPGLIFSSTLVVESDDIFYSLGQSGNIQKTLLQSSKVLRTDSTGLVVKTTYLEDVPYLKASDIDLSNLVTKNNIKTINGTSILGSGDIVITSASIEPSQITITTSTSITTDTLDTNGKKQLGKNVIINNGTSAINITVNGGTDFNASYLKHGTGAITFVQASGRTLVQVSATATLNGAAGSTATISSIGNTDYLRISNM